MAAAEPTRVARGIRLAVVGCGHGSLDAIYASVRASERASGTRVDLVLCCGDFQAVRNLDDLECMACPPKYRALCDFHDYYAGAKRAPVPTVFVGGNHEASAHLLELRHGGWAAPGVYFLGAAGAVRFAGLRIVGLSGIFDPRDYARRRFEAPPYDRSSMRSAYHVRAADVARLAALARADGAPAADVLLTHDWPQHVSAHGDQAALLRKKPFFRDDIRSGKLGSPAAATLLRGLRPRLHFSAHLHVKFAAIITHPKEPEPWVDKSDVDATDADANDGEATAATADAPAAAAAAAAAADAPAAADALAATATDAPGAPASLAASLAAAPASLAASLAAAPAPVVAAGRCVSSSCPGSPSATRFLALDKCLPRRPFMQVVDVPWADVDAHGLTLALDPEWLAVLAATPGLDRQDAPPGAGAGDVPRPSAQAVRDLEDRLRRMEQQRNRIGEEHGKGETFPIPPEWFVRTAPPYDAARRAPPRMPAAPLPNPQTDALLRAIGAPEEDAWGRLKDPSRAVGWSALARGKGGAGGGPSGRPARGPTLMVPSQRRLPLSLPLKRRATDAGARRDLHPGSIGDPNEIDIGAGTDPNEIDIGAGTDPNEIDIGSPGSAAPASAAPASAPDPNEIDLDDFESAEGETRAPRPLPARTAATPAPESSPPPPASALPAPSPAFLASWDPTELGTRPDPLGAKTVAGKEPILPALQNVLEHSKKDQL